MAIPMIERISLTNGRPSIGYLLIDIKMADSDERQNTTHEPCSFTIGSLIIRS
ncbi:MAG: hypothetical protein Fur0020_09620 [Thermodesulfovibrionia bacterium]